MQLNRTVLFTSLLAAMVLSSAQVDAKVIDGVDYQTGDVVFQQIDGALGKLVQGLTRSPFDHCGIIIVNADQSIDVLEAITRVQRTKLKTWKARGVGQRILQMRPLQKFREHLTTFIQQAENFVGRPYDRGFAMDDERVYCSELIYKAFRSATGVALAPFQKRAELNFLRHLPALLILGQGELPWNREVITPFALTRSDKLRVIHSEFDPMT